MPLLDFIVQYFISAIHCVAPSPTFAPTLTLSLKSIKPWPSVVTFVTLIPAGIIIPKVTADS